MSVNLNTFTSFEDVYKKPFHADEYGSFVWSSNGVMTFSGYDHANLRHYIDIYDPDQLTLFEDK